MEIDKIKRVMLGHVSGKEREEMEDWAGDSVGRRRFMENAREFYTGEEMTDAEVERRMQRIWRQMPVHLRRRKMLYRWTMAAACMFLALGVGWGLWLAGHGGHTGLPVGREGQARGVQLLLSDGSRHELQPGSQTVRIPGFRVDTGGVIRQETTKERAGATVVNYGEIVVPRGGEYTMILADGTKVMLNAETRLRFPEAFGDNERKVFLEGEAYFEVAKEEKRPFLVDFREGTVRVLGTRFNVKAYGGQEAVATLVNGKVEVASGQETVVLQPGEQCRITGGEPHTLVVGEADLMAALAWKNGEFVFKGASLGQVIDELARWYNVDIIYDHTQFQGSQVHIYMNRSQTLSEALDMLSRAWDIRYEQEGAKIRIKKR